MADKQGVPVIVAGDFNMIMDKSLDRFPQRVPANGTPGGPLFRSCEETGLVDIWRRWYPRVKQYSCHSRFYSTLSRIDLILCNEEALKIVEEIDYKPRGISDHSPIVFSIKVGVNYGRGDWKVNPFWLEIIKDT